jgi:hypothetical protein
MSGDATEAIMDKITIAVTQATGELLVNVVAAVWLGLKASWVTCNLPCLCFQNLVINATITVVGVM